MKAARVSSVARAEGQVAGRGLGNLECRLIPRNREGERERERERERMEEMEEQSFLRSWEEPRRELERRGDADEALVHIRT